MSYDVEKLCKKDYDEALWFLNHMFLKNGEPDDFEKELPIMCKRDDEHMGKHLVCRDYTKGGIIVALVGVYPLVTYIDDQRFMFSTVGNIATHGDYREKGYMKTLMNAAMEELKNLNADASRLGGFRQRYNRYGYEKSGSAYHFTLTSRNINDFYNGNFRSDITFRKIERTDTELLNKAWALFKKSKIHVDRLSTDDFYLTAIAWKMNPYAAFDVNGDLIGYLVASDSGTVVAEQYAVTARQTFEMLCSFIAINEIYSVEVIASPWENELCCLLGDLCENISVSTASNFKIINFEGIAQALLGLKAQSNVLPDGEESIEIRDYGTLEIRVDSGKAEVKLTDADSDVNIDKLEATRLLFGPFIPERTTPRLKKSSMLNLWLPLPLSWNNQDRV